MNHTASPRVAFFTDSLHEVNGVARTSLEFARFAQSNGLPMLLVHTGTRAQHSADGSLQTLTLERSRAAFAVDRDLYFDPLLWVQTRDITEHVRRFRADVIHVTSPGDAGQIGAYIAHKLRIPLVASWHTNVHEFGARRLEKLLRMLPAKPTRALATTTERISLRLLLRFYELPRVLFAPNTEIKSLLQARTGKPTFLMRRGVDTVLFNPAKRRRAVDDAVFQLGFVGRLQIEKDVRFLAELEAALIAAGCPNFRFRIVGQGTERAWLERHMRHADFTGVLHGEDLARAYADIDLFVFPSRTDTYGNVIQEAAASGVPSVVTNAGGPKFLVEHGVTGFVARDKNDFVRLVRQCIDDQSIHRRMREASRRAACAASWDKVFEDVYAAYETLSSSHSRHTRPASHDATNPPRREPAAS